MEAAFALIFTLEFVLKGIALRLLYFDSAYNLLDFVLMVVGLVNVLLTVVVKGEGVLDNKASFIRFSRVMRMLRIMRLFRLLELWQVLRARIMNRELCVDTAERIQKITILTCFARAHMQAQSDFSRFFGVDSKIVSSDAALCLLQSQSSVYQALIEAESLQEGLEEQVLRTSNEMLLRRSVAEDLKGFVIKAHLTGLLSSREAHTVTHPLTEQIRDCNANIKDAHFGLLRIGAAHDEAPDGEGWASRTSARSPDLQVSHAQTDLSTSSPENFSAVGLDCT